ncbi:glycoside hydrolase family 88 protein [Oceanobacillus iheyensis]|uniref:Hypothetical conserved protein n=1 Tax=Oceanobacillus iheyensis (strain DSM 14371 / CIP 107618 / JCM 11309 / KCTC 3954 / HTE831) TaxID=221109 RepID=Q8EPL5_OCEIH|nr:glycoside hydrolase family 88 protein [Oceanobacillus iheyensis]BAC14042.1 hypothetical conserved protein [Oceanobacillus iheyensis HTE831]
MNKITNLNEEDPLTWAEKACKSMMNQFTPSQLPPQNRWHYHQGVFLSGMLEVFKETQGNEYYNYVKAYVDNLIDEEGNFLFARSELDAIQPGLLLLYLYKHTGDKRYKIASEKLRNVLRTINKTREGGYWHKDKYPYQMWLDGLYMAGPFAIQFGQLFNEPKLIDLVLYQEQLMRSHTKNKENGLYHHGWDEKAEQPWATSSGRAPEVWGRALGWYAMVLTYFLELLPQSHSKQQELQLVLSDLFDSLNRYQDENSGLWYQVIDKGHLEDNWLESSCSCLFVYAMAKAVNNNYVDKKYIKNAQKGYAGILKHSTQVDSNNNLFLSDICIGTSIGDYNYYVGRDTIKNDLHGVGAFILASVEMHKFFNL